MAELSVSRKSIEEILSLTGAGMKGKIYTIPEYQRPYRWDIDECETLWNDLTNFYDGLKQYDDNAQEYFLGSIVTCTDAEDKRHIDVIDGQQRLTTLFLMLRAFYTKLEALRERNPTDKNIIGLMQTIEPCIWNVNEMSKEVDDKTSIHIKSLVVSDKDNDTFHRIIGTGAIPTNDQSNYARNYAFFIKQYDYYINEHPMDWMKLCLVVIKRCIMLPIECTSMESALTIFGTLNNRGMPLADSDIFKAELYKLQPTTEAKNMFADEWKDLDETTESSGLKTDDIFRYYSHVIRGATENKGKEIGLRRFYAGKGNRYDAFKENGFFKNIIDLADFWEDLNTINDRFKESTSTYCNTEAKKWLHCLNCYPNEYWKYPTSVFFNTHKNDFSKEQFADFLKRLMSYLFVVFVESPTVNTIKDPIFSFCIEISKTGNVNLSHDLPNDFAKRLGYFSKSKIAKPMLLLEAYLFKKDQKLISENFQIEHIFPQKWQNTNYNGWTIDEARSHLEMFGNKVVFEKKLNIIAGNGYFGKKKIVYERSTILEAKELAFHKGNDWTKEDIENRNEAVTERLENFFKSNLG